MKKSVLFVFMAFLAFACSKDSEMEKPEIQNLTKEDTFWTAYCCDLEGGGTGTECRNGRRDMCHYDYPCTTDDGMSAMWELYYTQAELDSMILNNIPIDNNDALLWIKNNTQIPIK